MRYLLSLEIAVEASNPEAAYQIATKSLVDIHSRLHEIREETVSLPTGGVVSDFSDASVGRWRCTYALKEILEP